MPTTDLTLRCSFCAKSKDEVTRVVAGPGVYICNECVDLCNLVLRDAPPPGSVPVGAAWDSMTDAEILDHLPRVSAVADQVTGTLQQWVTAARERGITWAAIGGALGMTRQSAWGRFSGEE